MSDSVAKVISLFTHPLVYLICAFLFYEGINSCERVSLIVEFIGIPALLYLFSFAYFETGTIWSPGKPARFFALAGILIGAFLYFSATRQTCSEVPITSRGPDYSGLLFFYILFPILILMVSLYFFKVSLHTLGLGILIVCLFMNGSMVLGCVAVALIPIVIWVRYHLKAHSKFELAAGLIAGLIVTYSILSRYN